MKIPHTHKRRAISAVFGFLIVFIIFIATIVPLSIYIFITAPSQFDRAARLAFQREITASEESLLLRAGTFSNGTLYINGTANGGTSVTITNVFTRNASNPAPLLLTLKPTTINLGSVFTQLNTGFNCSKATLADPCTASLISTSGRIFSVTYPPSSDIDNFCVQFDPTCLSASTAGIGYLTFDFENFNYYAGTCSTTAYPTGCTITQVGRAYTITGSADNYIAFSARIKNVDPSGRTIVLDSGSYLEAAGLNIARGGGRSLVYTYQIGVVSGGVIMPFSPITLKPGVWTTVYFVSMLTGNPTDKNAPSGTLPQTPIFLLFHGEVGGLSWGENFPITMIDWVN